MKGYAMTTTKEDGGKSLCRCGHTGDGPDSQHRSMYGPGVAEGHGDCLAPDCACEKFTWARWRSRRIGEKAPNRHVLLGLSLILFGLACAVVFLGCAALEPERFACDRAPDQIRAMTGPTPPRGVRYAYVIDCGVEHREAWRDLYKNVNGGR